MQVTDKMVEALTAEQVADHIGVTPYSDMRPFVVQAVKYAREKDAALAHREAEAVAVKPIDVWAQMYCNRVVQVTTRRSEADGWIASGYPATDVVQLCAPAPSSPAAQEAVAYMHPIGAIWRANNYPAGIDFSKDGWVPLYAAPPAVPSGMVLVPVEPTRSHLERLAKMWGYTLEETADSYAGFLEALTAAQEEADD